MSDKKIVIEFNNVSAQEAVLNTSALAVAGAFKVKNYENMAKINNLLTLDNYEMRRQLVEWKSELESNNNHYEKLNRDVAKYVDDFMNEKQN